MRKPPAAKHQNHEGLAVGPMRRDPSFVDRRRLDSDVRAFLRQPSSPWMVFDHEPSAEGARAPAVIRDLAPAATLAPQTTFFPPADRHTPIAEPSTAAMVSDLDPDERGEREAPEVERQPSRRRRFAVAAASLLVSAGITVVIAMGASDAVRATEAHRPARAAAAPMADDVPPPDLDPPQARLESAARASMPEPKVTTNKFGRLSIAGPARYKQVFLDGKRLLGTGVRSFPVMCGAHTIAVGNKADAKDVDVPCGGELAVTQ